jgi:hypothetical protein
MPMKPRPAVSAGYLRSDAPAGSGDPRLTSVRVKSDTNHGMAPLLSGPTSHRPRLALEIGGIGREPCVVAPMMVCHA